MRLEQCKGDWALVTGASSGIGREFCVQLAAAGMNLVIIARRRHLLQELAAELGAEHGIRTLLIEKDLGSPHAAADVKTMVSSAGIKIRLLINNAAFGPWGRFENTSAEVYETLIHLTASTPVSLSLLFLPDLTAFKESAIINLSSPAALQPIPYMAVYSAAKACLHNFSLALYEECKAKGVRVQTLLPGPTQSEFDAKAGAYESALEHRRWPASTVVRTSLSKLAQDIPLVTTAKGIYKQRIFAGLFPTKLVVRKVAAMFCPPDAKQR